MNEPAGQSPERKNVDRIEIGDRTIFLVGTAHVSRQSAELAAEVIGEVKPDTVAVELCAARAESLQNPDRWTNTDIVKVIREGRAWVLLAQLALAAFQKKLGSHLDVKPGAEMLRAMAAAREAGAGIIFADRDVRTTLKRTWAAIGPGSMFRIIGSIVAGLFTSEQISEAEIERLKSADALEELMRDFTAALPTVRTALIDERDQYLAARIQAAPGHRIVAIVGAGHVPGIKTWLGRSIDTAPLETIPPPRRSTQILGWLIPLLLVGLVAWSFFAAGSDSGTEAVEAWFWLTGIWAAAGAALAFGHPLTILSAFIAAPFTAANPFLASGWVAGLVEALIRRPRVGDFQTIADDLTSLRGIWRNRVSRVLLVMILTNLLGTLGTFHALGRLWSIAT